MNLNPFELEECLKLKDVNTDDSWGYGYEYSYEELIESITARVKWTIKAGFKDYQGEYFYFGEDGEGKVYFLNSGYGSCSGCDALQACDT